VRADDGSRDRCPPGHPVAARGGSTRRPSVAVLDVAAEPGTVAATENAFKGVFGRLAQGVTVVTSHGDDGPCGMTASSVSSLSLDPPLALVCFSNASRTLAVVSETQRFGLNVLKLHQHEPSSAFARPGSDPQRFARFPFELRDGIPMLRDPLAWAICRLEGLVRVGDHTIAIGLVQAASHDEGEPLVWHRGAYRGLAA
jgi:flavin reductase (DIM6/NTAB) family NADH-FMN oxidoreductase RutF